MNFFVSPYVFSSNPAKLIEFYQIIGLQPVITSGDAQQPHYAFMKASSGFLAVHGTPANFGHTGEAHLVFAVENYDGLKLELANRGIVVEEWDEAWGKQAGVLDPDGAGIWINTISHDLYGYQAHDAKANTHQIEVIMLKHSHDFAKDREFFANFGFTSLPGADEWWEQLRRDETSGSIGLHHPESDDQPYRDEPNNPLGGRVPIVSISLQTSEDLEQLAQRLTTAGYPAKVVTDAAATKVHVTDPEGNHLEINPLAK